VQRLDHRALVPAGPQTREAPVDVVGAAERGIGAALRDAAGLTDLAHEPSTRAKRSSICACFWPNMSLTQPFVAQPAVAAGRARAACSTSRCVSWSILLSGSHAMSVWEMRGRLQRASQAQMREFSWRRCRARARP